LQRGTGYSSPSGNLEELDPQSEASRPPLLAENISRRILTVRGHRVMLDADLAELYGVPTSRMNEAVKRNSIRFPVDFMFRLSAEEYTSLISQIAISKPGRRGGRRKLPYVFTEQGVAMLSSVLNSDRTDYGLDFAGGPSYNLESIFP
jgi:hypothetical protein